MIIAAGSSYGALAEAMLQTGEADLIAFGRHFIANLDVPARLRHQLPLNDHDRDTFYDGTA